MHEIKVLIPDKVYNDIQEICKKRRMRESDLLLLAINKVVEEFKK